MTTRVIMYLAAVLFLTVAAVTANPTSDGPSTRVARFTPTLLELWNNRKEIPSEEINFYLYTKKNKHTSYKLKWDIQKEMNLKNCPFNKNHETKIFIHGWTGKIEDPLMQEFVDVHLNGKNDYNVILVEWKAALNLKFYESASKVIEVAEEVAIFLRVLKEVNGLNPEKVHIYGFSLGAHVAGLAGRSLNGTIARITGLDPAGPREGRFSSDFKKHAITNSNAKFVDIIHTNIDFFGMALPVGHVDYFVNGHAIQKGCILGHHECYHSRATRIMIEFIKNPKAFTNVYKCPYRPYAFPFRVICKKKSNIAMGEMTNKRGIFYVVDV